MSSSALSIEERLRTLEKNNRGLQDTIDYQHIVLDRLLNYHHNQTDQIDSLHDISYGLRDTCSFLQSERVYQRNSIRRLQDESRRDEDRIDHIQNQVENMVSLPSSSQQETQPTAPNQGRFTHGVDNDNNNNDAYGGNKNGALKRPYYQDNDNELRSKRSRLEEEEVNGPLYAYSNTTTNNYPPPCRRPLPFAPNFTLPPCLRPPTFTPRYTKKQKQWDNNDSLQYSPSYSPPPSPAYDPQSPDYDPQSPNY
mmetsp:Transcript_58905/g.65991  ORF Transcript_58905/g.65991 Transcript_58905/m.65991 type:complete len:252 (+) Transcript_58905:97-852(+)